MLLLLGLASPPQSFGCEQSCWPRGQHIVVESGTISGAIRSGCGADTILVEEGAQVVRQGADAIGIDSDGGNDSVVNAGNIFVAASDAQDLDGKEWGRCGIHWKHSCFKADADATAIGIQTGNGQDSVLNTGSIEVSASAQLADSGTARTLAIGIDGGNGNDGSENSDSEVGSGSGTIEVSAASTASLSGETWELEGRYGADRSVDTEATALGILGGYGRDSIANDASLAVSAQSDISVAKTAVTLLEVHDADLSLHGNALAVGIDGGNGKDQIVNQGELIVTATSSIEIGSLTVTGLEASIKYAGDGCHTGTHGTELDGSIVSTAQAVGIDTGVAGGGHGKDAIINSGTLSVAAQSDITQSETSISLLQAAGADTSILGSALAVGIDGGSGKDLLSNQGALAVTATSSVETDHFALAGVSASSDREAEFDSSITAESRAVGIAAGNSCDEVLGIGNTSTISVQAASTVNADSYALSLADGVPFTQLGIVSDSSLTAAAEAAGIIGGRGNDTINNEGTLTVGATADIDSLAVELNLVDAAASKADLEARAGAVGIDSGSGNDLIQNSGALSATAKADTSSWSATFSAVDVAVGDFGSSSTAEAVGISSGQGADTIANTGSLTAAAASKALVADFSMSLFDLTPLAEDGGFSTTVEAEATGIAAGCQEDLITSSGIITATATTEATRIGVEIGAEGLPEFEDFGSLENLASADVSLSSKATGIDGGTGDDEITNQGSLAADASASSWGGSLGLSLPLVELPVPTPFPAFSMMDAGTKADAEAVGIQGGEGNELIRNEGDLDIDASASALNVVASIGFQGSVDDFAIAATRVDAMTEAQAAASGIEGGEGDDQILNSGDITVDAVAETLSVAANVAVQNKAEPKYLIDLQGTLADVRSTAAADASGILGSTGQDTITSSGDIAVSALSRNAGVGLSAAVTTEAEKGLVVDGAVVKADSVATAYAVGIDGGEQEDEIRSSGAVAVSAQAETLSASVALTYQGSSSKALGVQGALATVSSTSEATAEGLAGGTNDDLIVNEGALNVSADSLAIAASVAVDIMTGKSPGLGITLANAQNQATAEATGIDGGEGSDRITNSGAVTVDADATAVAASISVTRKGGAGSGTLDPATFDAGNSAEAAAKGIAAGKGDETIVNSGALNVSSTAVAPSVGVAVTTSEGISAAVTTAVASASSVGIDTGEGTHWIHNTGSITADSTAVAAGVSVSIAKEGAAAAIDTVWDGGTTATVDAAGIRAGSGNDHIENEAAISASSTAIAPSVDVAVTGKGISFGISTATSTASSVGIEAGAGDDWIENSGAITATAYANADAISVDISGKGVAGSGKDVWDGGVEASALARGIDAGEGSNSVVNSGSIAADSTATTVSAGVSIVGKGLSASVSAATATAKSIGIDPGQATPELWNSGDITAEATATAVTVNADIAGKGLAVALHEEWDGGTSATATARGIDTGAVDNAIWNQGAITASSEATTPSVGVAIAGKGLAAAVTTSTAEADAVGIDTAEGNDVVQSSGAIAATADADAYAISVAVTGKGVDVAGNAVWNGGTTASSRAVGIDTGAGSDSIVNAGNILADSSATTVGVGLSVAGDGLTAAVSTSTAKAQAVGIAAGEGADRVESIGDITADASSTAVTANVAVTGKGIAGAADAVWDGGTHSIAVAKAIDAGTGAEDDWILSQGDLTATSDATTVAVSAAITGKGISLATTTSTTTAQAVGIDAGAGSDTIQSEGTILADASATGVTVAASVTGTGASGAADAVWNGGTHTTALAIGIDAGGGDDCIASVGDITANSTAVTVGVDAAITGTGVSLATTTSTTVAQAVGINAGAGNETIQSQGAITADSSATGVAVAASITGTGASGAADAVWKWNGGTQTTALAAGIDAGDGDDGISSVGNISATSTATTVAVDAAITGTGLSLATSTATTSARATGIDGGVGNDTIQSQGAITADSSATGVAVAASITGTGASGAADAVWNGGTHTTALATGIDAGQGDDSVISLGGITANSTATTVAVDAAITGTGLSLATSTATTTAQAVGIEAGAGNDSIQSQGAITADSSATGVAVAASITGIGVSGSTDAVWKGGTDTSATAIGIGAGGGDDLLDVSGTILATADATTVAVDVGITGKGVSLAATASNTSASATGIDGGAGNDAIDNTAGIAASASSTGVGVAVGLTGLGLSGATDAVWDSGTTATTIAMGIAGGAGDDIISNTGGILLTSDADTVAVDVALTGAGVSAALTNTTAEARAVGIDGGEGMDSITNLGAIRGSATADAVGVGVSISGEGVAFGATDVWEDGISGQAVFAGIDAGSGNDAITNSGAIDGTSTATTPAVSVSVSGFGVGAAANTASAEARATGIDGGAGEDTITNTGAISVASTADANTVIVSLTAVGASAALEKTWDGGTTATAAATGIAGGKGGDRITNSAAISASATADTAATGVTMTFAGASASLVNSTAKAQAAGIDGGEGDDAIQNSGAITAFADADADTVAVSVSGVGASFGGDQWSEDTLASAAAVGIDGGAGNDAIQNTAAITATAISDSDATAVTVSLVGYADSEAENISQALAAGLSGGEGNDTIDNAGNITTSSTSTADAGSVTVNLAGAAPAEAGTTAMAVGIGIDGGAGDDTIRNAGNLSIASSAITDASSVAVTLVGYGNSEADNLASALATGIVGGEGSDAIINTGSITLASAAKAEAGSVSVGLAGAVSGEAGTTASAAAVGLDGGAGADVIQNSGAIAATVSASTDSSSTGVVLAGAADSSAECTSVAAATGISGGAGDDTIVNSVTGSIMLSSLATAEAGSVQVGLAGGVGGEAGTTAMAVATAIDGGLGSDTIRNAAQITVAATTSTSADSTTVGIFGSADADVNTTAVTLAQGISGGDGADSIENTGRVTVSSYAAMSLDAYSFDFGGSAAGQGTLSSDSSAVGISGGEGSDTIDNEGQILVGSTSTMTVEGGSDVAFGSAASGANTTAVTNAVGIDAGQGDDTVTNRSAIAVSALTAMTLDSSSFSFGGTAASGEGAMSASTRATGISGGEGSDAITSEAAVAVGAKTSMSALAGSDVAFGSADAGTSITADTQAAGIDAGAGNDTVVNRGGVTVGYYNSNATDAMTKINVSGSTWSFGGSGSVSAAALATGSSVGIDAGGGDDDIRNEANLEVNSTAYARTDSSSYTFAGGSGSSGTVTAATAAVGIRGGEGSDAIRNSALVTVRARSYAVSTGSAETTFGDSSAYAGAASSAAAAGIEGQAGDEAIENTGTVSVSAEAYAEGSTDSDVFAGSPSATSATTVSATAAGIDAGAGSNRIDNRGLIGVTAAAYSAPDATADSDISDNQALGSAGMSAKAVGISALEGSDAITNSESGSIVATAGVTAEPYAHSDEDSTANGLVHAATAHGIEAGGGNNTILNLGTIQASAAATIKATGVSRSLTHTAYSNALAAAAVDAAGITAGQGSDVIQNGAEGVILVDATASGTALGTPRPGEGAHTDVGSATVGLASFPLSASASGISAGDGDNTIDNLGLIYANAAASATARGQADTDNTSNRATANAVVAAAAAGIGAGDGADTVLNEVGARIDVRATAELTAVADPDERGLINNPGASAASAACGIALGDSAKIITNRGSISAVARSSLAAIARAESDLWDTDTRIAAAVTASAQGIRTGSGDSSILNSGDVEARATAESYGDSSSDSVDDAWSQLNEVLLAEAQGIAAAGGGTVVVENAGGIDAVASATAFATGRGDSGGDGYGEVYMTMDPTVSASGIGVGDAISTAIHNREDATIAANASLVVDLNLNGDEFAVAGRSWDYGVEAKTAAQGIAAGDGDVQITNDGSIEVHAEAIVDVWTYSLSTTRSTHTYAWISSAAAAVGIQAGSGAHRIDNAGTITVTAANRVDGNRGRPASDSYYNADAEVGAVAGTLASGIAAGDGDAQLSNSGTIDVAATSYAYGYTRGDSGAGDGNATTHVVTTAVASGISAGSGGSLVSVENSGGIAARSRADSEEAYAHGDDNSWAYATATGSAAGIELGSNAIMVVDNSGTIVAEASARSHGADDEPTVSSQASSSSCGIKVADGASTITNSGSIFASSESEATWWSDERTYWSGAAAEAAGIQGGAGNKSIVNDGTIESKASATVNYGAASAVSYGIRALSGNNTIINNGSISSTAELGGGLPSWTAQAYGIQTGSGNDLIINKGTITTHVTVNGVSVKGIGIDAGSGDDEVIFGDGSYIGCTLDLGEGNDGLTVIGSGTISGNVYAGLGTDRITLDGATNFDLDRAFDFEALAKLGASTVSLNNAQMLEQLEVWEGVLQINNGYQFTPEGAFSASLYGGGSCGQLLVSGGLGLDGTMTVVRGPGAYLDGATYEVLTADSLSGSFDSIVLPDSTPLLSFALADGGSNSYKVTASTEAFATVAATPNQRALAGCMDSIVGSAKGDLSLVLGGIQAMQPDGYSAAFASLSPDSYASTTRSTLAAADQFSQALSSRLRSLRPLSSGRTEDDGLRPPLQRLGYGTRSGQGADGERMADYGLWASGFGQWGGLTAADGYTGFGFDLYGSTLGYDRYLGRGLTAGASLGYANTQLYYEGGGGAGRIDSVTGSAYGSFTAGLLHLDTALSYGRQSCENSRTVVVGSIERMATSEHGSNALLAYLGGGLTLGRRLWTLEPLASAQYVCLNEEGFTEEGAGSVSLNVQERTAHSLLSDLGLRLGLRLDFARRTLASELFAAWRHDFALDPGTITASFVDAPEAPFTVSGPEAQRNGVLLGASLLLRESRRFSAAVKYSLELRGAYRANSLSGEIQYGK